MKGGVGKTGEHAGLFGRALAQLSLFLLKVQVLDDERLLDFQGVGCKFYKEISVAILSVGQEGNGFFKERIAEAVCLYKRYMSDIQIEVAFCYRSINTIFNIVWHETNL